MITRRKFIAATALIGPLALAAGATKSTEAKEVQEETEMADWLFVQNAKSVTYAEGKLTLKGVNPVTVMFTDRPEREAAHMSTEKFVPFWSEGKDSFLKDPPNAALSFLENAEMEDVIVTLMDPKLNGEDLSYTVKIVKGTIPETEGMASLFIDIIGMPLTPLSVAGVRRRVWRREMYRR